MKLKKLLFTLSLAGTGLVTLTIGLPMLLTSCANEDKSNTQNPIIFNKLEQPVKTNQELKITANINNLSSYIVTWSYSINDGAQEKITKGISNTDTTTTLTIPSSKVTVALNNVTFIVQVTNKTSGSIFSATTKVTVEEPAQEPSPQQPVTSTIAINVNGNKGVTVNKTATLTATASCENPQISKWGYQWYYKLKNSSTAFFDVNNSPLKGWINCGTKANSEKLIIPSENVTPQLANYQFMVMAYNLENPNQYNVSSPIEISFTPVSALGNVQPHGMMTNVVSNITSGFNSPTALTEQLVIDPNPLVMTAVAKPELVQKFEQSLGLVTGSVKEVTIQLGKNLLNQNSMWIGDNVALDINLTLNPGYTFGEKQTALGCNNIIDNINAEISLENDKLSMTNIQTNIKNIPLNGSDTKTPSPQLQALAEKINSYNWNNFENIQGITVKLNEQTLPLFEDFAKYANVPIACISGIEIAGRKSIAQPSQFHYNTLYFRVGFNGVNVGNFTCDGLDKSGNYAQEDGNWVLGVQITDRPNTHN